MVSGRTFHLRSWERRHDRHGKRLAAAPPPPACTGPGRGGRSAISGCRRVPVQVGPKPPAHTPTPSRAPAGTRRGRGLTASALVLAARLRAPSPQLSTRASETGPLPGTPCLFSSRIVPRPIFLPLCVPVWDCLMSLLPVRLYPPGHRALSTPPAWPCV